ncbi:maleylpyruvate isomerase family mycothiol-dependent enzyme [Salininema proteolyticum]|uniref:Maleylpyruvate isomerase family mycothiol-dependent enzyme n=1 Tax=Salininema proteolyticum TaxID=1607685 RepID=A0ABV8U5H0_9ACTN
MTTAALRSETDRLTTELRTLSEEDWGLPTRCGPWTVADLVAHVSRGIARVSDCVAGPEPLSSDTDAVGYFRPGDRFSAATDGERLASAQRAAEGMTPDEHVSLLERRLSAALADASSRPGGRRVVTRHGDRMELGQFVLTRVIEVALHGIDVADAVGRPRWTTDEAADVLLPLFLKGHNDIDIPEASEFLARASGRAPLGPDLARRLEEAGIDLPSFG